MGGLSGLLKAVNKGWLRDVLVGAGLTLATAGVSLTVFNQLINSFKNNLNSVPHDILALAHIAGFDIYFSLILGAIVTKFTLSSGNLGLKKLGK